jgi:hypothetical protein
LRLEIENRQLSRVAVRPPPESGHRATSVD